MGFFSLLNQDFGKFKQDIGCINLKSRQQGVSLSLLITEQNLVACFLLLKQILVLFVIAVAELLQHRSCDQKVLSSFGHQS